MLCLFSLLHQAFTKHLLQAMPYARGWETRGKRVRTLTQLAHKAVGMREKRGSNCGRGWEQLL